MKKRSEAEKAAVWMVKLQWGERNAYALAFDACCFMNLLQGSALNEVPFAQCGIMYMIALECSIFTACLQPPPHHDHTAQLPGRNLRKPTYFTRLTNINLSKLFTQVSPIPLPSQLFPKQLNIPLTYRSFTWLGWSHGIAAWNSLSTKPAWFL